MRKPEELDLGGITFHPVKKETFEVNGDGTEYEHGQIAIVDNLMEKVLGFHNEDNYSLIQHVKVVSTVSSFACTKEILGNYKFNRHRDLFLYYFPEPREDYVVEFDSGETFRIGVRITNSYSGSYALKARLVAYDLENKVGMQLKGLVSKSYHRHTKHSGQIKKFKKELADLLEFDEDDFIELIQESKRKYLDRDEALEAIRIPDKLRDLVREEADEGFISAWDIYSNLARQITVQQEEYEEATLEQMHREANKILKAKVEEIDVKVDEVEEEEEEEKDSD